MSDITPLEQTEINDALAQLKQLSEYPTPSTQYARVLRKYITSLVEALEAKLPHHNGMMQLSNELVMAKQRIAELESRTVTVKLPDERFRYGESDYDDGYVNGWNAHGIEVKRLLADAGIQVIEGEGQ